MCWHEEHQSRRVDRSAMRSLGNRLEFSEIPAVARQRRNRSDVHPVATRFVSIGQLPQRPSNVREIPTRRITAERGSSGVNAIKMFRNSAFSLVFDRDGFNERHHDERGQRGRLEYPAAVAVASAAAHAARGERRPAQSPRPRRQATRCVKTSPWRSPYEVPGTAID